jgi:hypothetical protein
MAMLCDRQHLPPVGPLAQPHCIEMAGGSLTFSYRSLAQANRKSGPRDPDDMNQVYNTMQLTVVIYGKVRSFF